LTASLLARLRAVDTPTVCNALVSIDPSLKGRCYTIAPVMPARPYQIAVAGYARTARIVSSEPPDAPPDAIRTRRFDYYRYVAAGQAPSIVVMQDIGRRPGFGCIWGGLNVALHKGLGVSGAITDGAIRDLNEIDPEFLLLGAAVTPGSGFAHLVDFDTPVEVFGLQVHPGDLVHADRHGAVVIPSDAAHYLEEAIALVLRREKILFDAAGLDGFDHAKLLDAWARFEAEQ
jgi:regulator of RNase E activity RraA